jgi:hypothetical protein
VSLMLSSSTQNGIEPPVPAEIAGMGAMVKAEPEEPAEW